MTPALSAGQLPVWVAAVDCPVFVSPHGLI